MVEAGGVKQKIADGDRSRRRTRCGARLAGHNDVLEFGDERGDRVVEGEAALFVQHHHRDGRHGFGHRVDAKERPLGHRRLRLEILNADGFEVCHLAASRHGRDGPGNPMLRDVSVQQIGRVTETRSREPGGVGPGARSLARHRRRLGSSKGHRRSKERHPGVDASWQMHPLVAQV